MSEYLQVMPILAKFVHPTKNESVTTLWQPLTKYQTITFNMIDCYDLPLLEFCLVSYVNKC
jgi:hypothetical protein